MKLFFSEVLGVVADERHVCPDEIVSHTRIRPVAYARQEVMYLSRKLLPLSLPQIGNRIGRDHSTVMYGCDAVEERMKCSHYKEEIEAMEMRLKPMFIRHDALMFKSVRSPSATLAQNT